MERGTTRRDCTAKSCLGGEHIVSGKKKKPGKRLSIGKGTGGDWGEKRNVHRWEGCRVGYRFEVRRGERFGTGQN